MENFLAALKRQAPNPPATPTVEAPDIPAAPADCKAAKSDPVPTLPRYNVISSTVPHVLSHLCWPATMQPDCLQLHRCKPNGTQSFLPRLSVPTQQGLRRQVKASLGSFRFDL